MRARRHLPVEQASHQAAVQRVDVEPRVLRRRHRERDHGARVERVGHGASERDDRSRRRVADSRGTRHRERDRHRGRRAVAGHHQQRLVHAFGKTRRVQRQLQRLAAAGRDGQRRCRPLQPAQVAPDGEHGAGVGDRGRRHVAHAHARKRAGLARHRGPGPAAARRGRRGNQRFPGATVGALQVDRHVGRAVEGLELHGQRLTQHGDGAGRRRADTDGRAPTRPARSGR